jgi:poly-gamma-glutamate synthesis protein (capsule biosynthesis protein)
MLGRDVDAMILENGPLYPWGDLLPLLQTADLLLINLESVIAEGGEPFQPPRVFYLRADPKAIEVLTRAGVDYVTLSNNHTMDFQEPALLETIHHLDEYGIAHAGAGADIEEASRFAMLEARGIRVGVVAFADHYEEYAATEDSAGTNVISISVEGPHFSRVERAIDAVRAAGADLVVFSIHWGPNMRHVPPPEFREFARAVIDAGADIFHGHSAHVFQGIEIYEGKPILYDTGDLIDDYYAFEQHRNDQQLLFLITATGSGVEGIELVPVLISNSQVNVADVTAFDQIYHRIRDLSAAMGTEVRREGDRLVIDVSAPPAPVTSLPAYLERVSPAPGTRRSVKGESLLLRVDVLADGMRAADEELSRQEVILRNVLIYDGVVMQWQGYADDGGWMVGDAEGSQVYRVAPSLYQVFWSAPCEPGLHEVTHILHSGSGEVLEYTWYFELAVED